MKIIDMDIIKISDGIIAHQVNCRNRMKSGVAKALYIKYPLVKESYHKQCELASPTSLLGEVFTVKVTDDLYVFNCFSQLNYGYDNARYTDYDAIRECFKEISYLNDALYKKQVYIPYLYGCGLGNGKWNIVESIIDEVCSNVIACRI